MNITVKYLLQVVLILVFKIQQVPITEYHNVYKKIQRLNFEIRIQLFQFRFNMFWINRHHKGKGLGGG